MPKHQKKSKTQRRREQEDTSDIGSFSDHSDQQLGSELIDSIHDDLIKQITHLKGSGVAQLDARPLHDPEIVGSNLGSGD